MSRNGHILPADHLTPEMLAFVEGLAERLNKRKPRTEAQKRRRRELYLLKPRTPEQKRRRRELYAAKKAKEPPKLQKPRKKHPRQQYDPSPEEIRAACLKIQAGWTPADWKRRGECLRPVETPIVATRPADCGLERFVDDDSTY